MTEAKAKGCTEELLGALYKNIKMGADSILNTLPKVEESRLRRELTAQLNRYEELAGDIGKELCDCGASPEEKGMMAKLGAKMGIAMNTAIDSTPSHIAQMMIEGATMGITENTKLLRKYENSSCSEQALKLTKESIKFMEDSVERMKKYL